MTTSQKARLLGVLFILMFLAFVATANASVHNMQDRFVSQVKSELGIVDPMIRDGSGCEVLPWISGAFVGCYGDDAGKTEAHALTLEGKGYKVTRAGKALVVVK